MRDSFLKVWIAALALGAGLHCVDMAQGYNADGLRRDMATLFTVHGGVPRRIYECKMIGQSRAGLCLFAINAAEFSRLARVFQLEQAIGDESNSFLETWLNSGGHEQGSRSTSSRGCAFQEGFDPDGQQVRLVYTPEPRTGPIRDHIHFEYFLLFYNAQTNRGCAQTSYSYG